jgi:hypothetical protein
MDHSSITGSCSGCHDGITATGKTPTHINSTNTCDDCHNTIGWLPATVDHTSVNGTCYSCHDGITAPGKTPTHVLSSNNCDDCHTTTAWIPAGFDHSSGTGSCSTCHNGTTAIGKPKNHFVTTLQCDECHSTSNWTSIDFDHSSGDYPGDHNSSVVCLSCHTSNSQNATWDYGAYKPDCAGCHANDYVEHKHKKYKIPSTVYYTLSELRDCSGTCHEYVDSSMTKIKDFEPGEHKASDGVWH